MNAKVKLPIAINAYVNHFGYDAAWMEKATRKVIDLKRFLAVVAPDQAKLDLATTCALEHFTATIAAQLLRRTDMQALMQDPTMLKMWQWHAVEENELDILLDLKDEDSYS